MNISYFDKPHGTEATVNSLSFDELADLLQNPQKSTIKEVDSISPFVYSDNYRNNNNALSADIIIVDIDNAPIETTAKDIINAVKPFQALAHSTFNHKTDGKGARFRLFVPLSNSVSKSGYKESMDVLVLHMGNLGQFVDKASFNPSQQFYLPACPENRIHEFEFASFEEDKLFEHQNNNPLIGEGNRHTELARQAYTLKSKGIDDKSVKDIINATNKQLCLPNLPQSEVDGICRSAEEIGNNLLNNLIYGPFTQGDFADYITDKLKNQIIYCTDSNEWFRISEDKIWTRAYDAEIKSFIYEEIKYVLGEVAKITNLPQDMKYDLMTKVESKKNASFVSGTFSILSLQQKNQKQKQCFDANPRIVGCKNGLLIDLDNFAINKIKHDDYLTKTIGTHYDENAECPVWERSIEEWTCRNDELAKYLQTFCGYCLSGDTAFQGINFLYGSGANGKSVFLGVLSQILNDYSKTVDSSSLMMNNRGAGSANGDIARLAGARLVTSSELPGNKSFNEELLKSLTGSDIITARNLFESEFEFRPQLKLVIVGNHQPVIRSTDDGIWRRMKLVPFEAKIQHKNPNLNKQLTEELPGILNWMLKGWSNYKKDGHLKIPKIVEEKSTEYRSEMNIMGNWVDECIEKDDDAKASSSSLFRSYDVWCKENNYTPLSVGSWSREFVSCTNARKSRRGDGNYYHGFRVKQMF